MYGSGWLILKVIFMNPIYALSLLVLLTCRLDAQPDRNQKFAAAGYTSRGHQM
jgi:hypothetical protein